MRVTTRQKKLATAGVAVLALSLSVVSPAVSQSSSAPFGYYPGTDHPYCPSVAARTVSSRVSHGDWDNSRNYDYDGSSYGCRVQSAANPRDNEISPEQQGDPRPDPSKDDTPDHEKPGGGDDDKPNNSIPGLGSSPIDELINPATPVEPARFPVEPPPDKGMISIEIVETSGNTHVQINIGPIKIPINKSSLTTRQLANGRQQVIGIDITDPNVRAFDRQSNGALSNFLTAKNLETTTLGPTDGRWASDDLLQISWHVSSKHAKYNVYRNGKYHDTVIREGGKYRAAKGRAVYSPSGGYVAYRDLSARMDRSNSYSIRAILPNGKWLRPSGQLTVPTKAFTPEKNSKGWTLCPDQKYNKYGAKSAGTWDNLRSYTNTGGRSGGCYIE